MFGRCSESLIRNTLLDIAARVPQPPNRCACFFSRPNKALCFPFFASEFSRRCFFGVRKMRKGLSVARRYPRNAWCSRYHRGAGRRDTVPNSPTEVNVPPQHYTNTDSPHQTRADPRTAGVRKTALGSGREAKRLASRISRHLRHAFRLGVSCSAVFFSFKPC